MRLPRNEIQSQINQVLTARNQPNETKTEQSKKRIIKSFEEDKHKRRNNKNTGLFFRFDLVYRVSVSVYFHFQPFKGQMMGV